MGGDDDEDEGPVDMMDPAFLSSKKQEINYSGQGDAGAGLDLLPRKEYVMRNFNCS